MAFAADLEAVREALAAIIILKLNHKLSLYRNNELSHICFSWFTDLSMCEIRVRKSTINFTNITSARNGKKKSEIDCMNGEIKKLKCHTVDKFDNKS